MDKEKYSQLTALDNELLNTQNFLSELGQKLLRGEFDNIFSNCNTRNFFYHELKIPENFIRIIRNPLIYSAAIERGVPEEKFNLRDLNSVYMKDLKKVFHDEIDRWI